MSSRFLIIREVPKEVAHSGIECQMCRKQIPEGNVRVTNNCGCVFCIPCVQQNKTRISNEEILEATGRSSDEVLGKHLAEGYTYCTVCWSQISLPGGTPSSAACAESLYDAIKEGVASSTNEVLATMDKSKANKCAFCDKEAVYVDQNLHPVCPEHKKFLDERYPGYHTFTVIDKRFLTNFTERRCETCPGHLPCIRWKDGEFLCPTCEDFAKGIPLTKVFGDLKKEVAEKVSELEENAVRANHQVRAGTMLIEEAVRTGNEIAKKIEESKTATQEKIRAKGEACGKKNKEMCEEHAKNSKKRQDELIAQRDKVRAIKGALREVLKLRGKNITVAQVAYIYKVRSMAEKIAEEKVDKVEKKTVTVELKPLEITPPDIIVIVAPQTEANGSTVTVTIDNDAEEHGFDKVMIKVTNLSTETLSARFTEISMDIGDNKEIDVDLADHVSIPYIYQVWLHNSKTGLNSSPSPLKLVSETSEDDL